MSLINTQKFTKLCLKNHVVLFNAVRNHWNKDYYPGPFPTTHEAREAAAKKYGLLPEEYHPQESDGLGMGDYPVLPTISAESKNPAYPWDNPELKRNFNEPMHHDFDLMGEDRYDMNYKFRTPLRMQFLQFFLVMAGCFGVYFALENVKSFAGTIPKQYPFQGKTHYTFEPKE